MLYWFALLALASALCYSRRMSASIHLDATLFSGQTFAWSKQDGVYQAVVGRQLVCFTEKTFDPLLAQNGALRRYFDMDWEYGRAESYLSSLDPHLARAIQAYKGLHILNQDPWEVLMGFLLSQNNNIKRIRGMYELLSKHFGTHVEGPWYAFPRQEQLMNVSEQDLRQLGMGFRAPYLLDAIQNHALLQAIPDLGDEEAYRALQTIRGVGPKVALCILAFAFHRQQAFPLDTWMLKVMKTRYPGRDASYFAPYAALAQQYLFHFERTQGGRL